MKILLLSLFGFMMSLGFAENVLDELVDSWLDHTRTMMRSVKNHQTTFDGLQFTTPCGALITWGNCTVAADSGVMTDMSTLARFSEVSVVQEKNGTASIELDLAYDVLQIHYPNLIVTGLVNLEYKKIIIDSPEKLPFKLHMVLDYSNDATECTNSILVTPPALPQFNATALTPEGTRSQLPPAFSQLAVKTIIEQITGHIRSLIEYENVCNRLANLF